MRVFIPFQTPKAANFSAAFFLSIVLYVVVITRTTSATPVRIITVIRRVRRIRITCTTAETTATVRSVGVCRKRIYRVVTATRIVRVCNLITAVDNAKISAGVTANALRIIV